MAWMCLDAEGASFGYSGNKQAAEQAAADNDLCPPNRVIPLYAHPPQASGSAAPRPEVTAEERTVVAILRWQNNPMVHPLTCGRKSAHRLLFPWLDEESGAVVLLCPDCDYKQTHIPPMFAHHLPSDAPSGWDTDVRLVLSEVATWITLAHHRDGCRQRYREACTCGRDSILAKLKFPASPPQDAPVNLSAVEAELHEAIDDYGYACVDVYRGKVHPLDENAARDKVNRLLSLYRTALSGVPANPRASETAENIARRYVPQSESVSCGDALAVLGFRDRVALVEAGRAIRDDFDVDVLRSLCGEAAQCTAEVNTDAARELTVRLNQAWRGEDPCGVPAKEAGETK